MTTFYTLYALWTHRHRKEDMYVRLKPCAACYYQGNYCAARKLDPEDPRCAHVILAGEMVPLKKNSQEEIFAKQVGRDDSRFFFFNDPNLDPIFMGFFFSNVGSWFKPIRIRNPGFK